MGTGGSCRRGGDGMSEPLRLVIGFSTGSASHDAALDAAPRIETALGRRVEFEFIHGETGTIAARHVAALPPDGNVFLICTMGTHALQPALGAVAPLQPCPEGVGLNERAPGGRHVGVDIDHWHPHPIPT